MGVQHYPCVPVYGRCDGGGVELHVHGDVGWSSFLVAGLHVACRPLVGEGELFAAHGRDGHGSGGIAVVVCLGLVVFGNGLESWGEIGAWSGEGRAGHLGVLGLQLAVGALLGGVGAWTGTWALEACGVVDETGPLVARGAAKEIVGADGVVTGLRWADAELFSKLMAAVIPLAGAELVGDGEVLGAGGTSLEGHAQGSVVLRGLDVIETTAFAQPGRGQAFHIVVIADVVTAISDPHT
jgi:hypothetical protein